MKHRVAALSVAFGALGLALPLTAFADDAACVDASESALTLRRDGKLRDALKQLAICGAPSCPREVTEECTRRARIIEDAMPTLVPSATDAAGNDVVSATVTIDGVVVATKVEGRPIALDPGAHVVRVEGAGIIVEKNLVLRESEKGRRENFVLARSVAQPPLAPPPAPPPQQGPVDLGTQKELALVAGGIGVVGLAFGVTFGLVAKSKQTSEQRECSAASCGDHEGAVSDYGAAHDAATISTVSFIAGGVFLATGVVLFFTAPKSATPRTGAAMGSRAAMPFQWTF